MILSDVVIEAAIERLRKGEIIIHPTESVYGFGGLLDDAPLRALQRLKGRPQGGFVVLIPGIATVDRLLGDVGLDLAEAFWPGPLTLVLDDRQGTFHPRAKASDGSVAVRVPGHEGTLELLARCGRPMTSSSANRPGFPPARTANEARATARERGEDLFAIDAGPLAGGHASTLLRLAPEGPELIREGRIDVLQLGRVTRIRRHGPRSPELRN